MPNETPLALAQHLREVVDDSTAAAMQRAGVLSAVVFLGKLEVFGSHNRPPTTLPTPAEHHQQIAETFASQTVADAGAVP